MSGHSHWSTIKHKKGAADKKRGKIYSKIARLITTAARDGGGELEMNPKLRLAIDKARSVNMPKDNIDRAIKKGTGELEGEQFVDLVYEGYGPKGVAIICDIMTDNRNRTASEVKKLFEIRGGNMGASGCVSWMFKKRGFFSVPANSIAEDVLMNIVLDAGGDDLQNVEGRYEVYTAPDVFLDVKAALEKAKVTTEVAEITMIPDNHVKIEDLGTAKKVLGLMEDLEDHDDVQNVYANFDIPESIIKELEDK